VIIDRRQQHAQYLALPLAQRQMSTFLKPLTE